MCMCWKRSDPCVARVTGLTGLMSKPRFRTIIRWTGDDPEREGLIETPSRMARSFEEFFVGYAQDPVEFLQKTFEESKVMTK